MQRHLPNIDALALLPSLRWRCHPRHAGIFGVSLLSLQWHPLCPCHAGIVAVAALALLPLSCWHCCCSCAGVVALVALTSSPLASSPLLRWHLCHHCSGIVNVVALVSLLLVYLRAHGHPLLREGDDVVVLVAGLSANVRICWRHGGGGGHHHGEFSIAIAFLIADSFSLLLMDVTKVVAHP
jgi:hypothetical protein